MFNYFFNLLYVLCTVHCPVAKIIYHLTPEDLIKVPLFWEEEKLVHLFVHTLFWQGMKDIFLIIYHLSL